MAKDMVHRSGSSLPQVPEGQLILVPPGYVLSTQQQETVNQASFTDYILLVWRKRGLVAFLLLLCLAGAAALIMFSVPKYEARAKMRIEPEEPNLVSFQGGAVSVASARKPPEFTNTQIQIIRGRQLAGKVINKLGLSTSVAPTGPPSMAAQLRGKVTNYWQLLMKRIGIETTKAPMMLAGREVTEAELEELKREEGIDAFIRNLDVEPVRETELVEIRYDSPDPRRSAAVVNTLCNEYIRWTYESKDESNQYTREWLKQKIDEIKVRLEQSENDLLAVTGGKDFVPSGEAHLPDQLELLRQKVADAERTLFEKQFEFKRFSSEKNYSALQRTEDTHVSKLLDEAASAKTELEKQSVLLGPNSDEVRKARSQLNTVQDQLHEAFLVARQRAQLALDQAQANYDFLRKNYDAEKGRIGGIQKDLVQYNILNREVSTNRELYNLLLQRWKEIGVATGAKVGYASVAEQAIVPVNPASPNKARILLLAVFLGLFLGVCLVLFQDFLDTTVKDPIELERLVRLPLLGFIPKCDLGRGWGRKKPRIELMIHDRPRSDFAEAIRSVRTAIQYSQSSSDSRMILITSCLPGEGKTTVASNLAAALAGLGKKVLLVDADLKKSSLSRLYKVEGKKGLSEILGGGSDEDVILETQIPNLFLLPSGSRIANPVEVLDSEAMRAFLDRACDQYDQVIVDTTPALNMADASVLAPYVDGVLMVVRPGVTPREAVRRVKDRLINIQGNVLGVIANNPTRNVAQRFADRLGFGPQYRHYGRKKNQWDQGHGKNGEEFLEIPVISRRLIAPGIRNGGHEE